MQSLARMSNQRIKKPQREPRQRGCRAHDNAEHWSNRGNVVAELTTMQSIGVTGGLKYMLYVRDLIALLLNNPVRVELAYTTVGMVISRFGHNNLPELISS